MKLFKVMTMNLYSYAQYYVWAIDEESALGDVELEDCMRLSTLEETAVYLLEFSDGIPQGYEYESEYAEELTEDELTALPDTMPLNCDLIDSGWKWNG